MKPYKYLLPLSIVILSAFLVLAACQRKSHEMNPGIKVHFNKINIMWEGINRLTGGSPVLQNTKITCHEVHTVEKDSIYIFEYLHNLKDHIEIKAIISPVHNTIVFYLSPNNYHTQKASDFVGIMFEDIPDMTGITAVFNGVHKDFKNFAEIGSDSADLVLIKYKDGHYAAGLPLAGQGYCTFAGVYHQHAGFKAYHTMDGHTGNDIPIAAIAFGDDPATIIQNLKNDPIISQNIIQPEAEF